MKNLDFKFGFNFAISIIIISSFFNVVHGWDNAEFEMFDLVEEVNKNFYEVIGVSPDATSKEIKQAYRKLSVKLHPDKNPSPDASEKFRQLVGIYEVLKDEQLRKSYDDVLINGLPNWRQPIFYFRRARKLAMWQVSLILTTIISVGQILAGWASYFERKLNMRETIEYKLRQKQRSRKAQKDGPTVEEIEAEMELYLRKPSIFDILPFQLCRGVKYLIFNFPGDVIAHYQEVKLRQEEEAREQARLQEIMEEQRKLAEEPKKPRKRKTFKIPEKEYAEDENEEAEPDVDKEERKKPTRPTYISGGLWTDEDLGELAKLCSKFPGGTPERWEKISDALRRPVPEVIFMAKKIMEKLTKPKEEEEVVPQLKVKVKTKGGKADAIAAGELHNVASWTVEEQKYLEKALIVYPKGAIDRWDKIASMVPGRSKEECMSRFKYVADLVKKKKEKCEQSTTDVTNNSPPSTSNESSELNKDPYEKEPGPAVESKDSVERKNSSSSNKSSSDGDWCLVETSAEQSTSN